MVREQPLTIKYIVGLMYILIFFLASFITSMWSTTSFKDMVIVTATVTIYWYISLLITKPFKSLHDFRILSIKTVVSLLVILVVIIIQQFIFINIPFSSSFVFFGISLVLLLLFHWIVNVVVTK
ncbi:hypothetical protein [Aquibacillus salsiterrae]|uniref:Uncharacterized protein n=1 Tax=Aquibacillus salsiterrae TaxID=2950439 RepID=A0A9X4AEE2_9BACI|nr:hypothetical protein [Aquibacillus salsiterrae]MDC3416767.1 hypothetical protein [Aquibacillus salsiterrae]